MGECGCGDREPSYWMRGPEGRLWIVQVWPETCASCGGQPGVRIAMCADEPFWRESGEQLTETRDQVYIDFPRSRRKGAGG